MKLHHITAPLAGILLIVISLLAPVIMLLVLPFIRWDDKPTLGSYGDNPVIRGSLPRWLRWLETPDERLPGGLYEPTVRAMYDKWGQWVTSWYWLGIRNTVMGLAVAWGKPAGDYIPESLGYWQRDTDDLWRYAAQIAPGIKFVTGYQVYRTLDGSFKAAPVFTIKRF